MVTMRAHIQQLKMRLGNFECHHGHGLQPLYTFVVILITESILVCLGDILLLLSLLLLFGLFPSSSLPYNTLT